MLESPISFAGTAKSFCFNQVLEVYAAIDFCWNHHYVLPEPANLFASIKCRRFFFGRISTGGFSFFRFFCWTWQFRSMAASRRRGRRGSCKHGGHTLGPAYIGAVAMASGGNQGERGGTCGRGARVAAVVTGKNGKPRASAGSRPARVQSGMCAAPFSHFSI